jgi:maltose-binding protein MalE
MASMDDPVGKLFHNKDYRRCISATTEEMLEAVKSLNKKMPGTNSLSIKLLKHVSWKLTDIFKSQ